MLTPAFELSQHDDSLTILIKVPYAKISESDLDVYFKEHDFKFYCKPYFLRLNLPGKVVYVEEPSVKYDVHNYTFKIVMTKATPGEWFDGLDLLTKLLAPKQKTSKSASLIEVIAIESGNRVGLEIYREKIDKNWIGGSSDQEKGEEDDDFDWEVEQTLPEEKDDDDLSHGGRSCGFANLYSCSVFRLKEESREIFDIQNVEGDFLQTNHEERLLHEVNNFSDSHYLADLYEEEEVQQLLKFPLEWENLYGKTKANLSTRLDEMVVFTSEEKEKLRNFPNKEHLLDKSQIRTLLLGLIDIIFAYAYNKRTTEGDNTVESAWTINKLSATLSWLETFSSVKSVVQSSVRRSLCYPLYRNWDLAMCILSDTKKIFGLGRKYVLKCLLEIHDLFNGSDPRYILNDMYITDYCIWIQSCKTKMIVSLSEALEKVEITKQDMDLDIFELETGAKLAIAEQQGFKDKRTDRCYQQALATASVPVSSDESTSDNSESLCLRFDDLKVVEKPSHHVVEIPECSNCNSQDKSKVSEKNVTDNVITNSNSECHIPLDPTQYDSDDDSSESGSSSSDSGTSSDSCDYSESSEALSDDSDDESSGSDDSDEHCQLLKKDKSYERRR